jgi:putative ABC transport system permease protein
MKLQLLLWVLGRSLRMRSFANGLTMLAVVLGVGLALVVPMSVSSFEKGAVQAASIFDLLITSDGSQSQAVLNSIYYQDVPLSNMPYRVYEALREDERTVRAVPLGFGDNYEGFPIVGTTLDYFELRSKPSDPLYYRLEQGELFSGEEHAVIGSFVASSLGLNVADRFQPMHGVEAVFEEETHNHEYEVSGILKATGGPSDRAIYVDLTSVWEVHGQGEHTHAEESHGEELAETHADEPHTDELHTNELNSDEVAAHEEELHAEVGSWTLDNLDTISMTSLDTDDRGITAILWAPHDLNDVYVVANQINNDIDGIQAIFPGSVISRLALMVGEGRQTYSLLANLILVLAVITVALNTYANALQAQKNLAILRAVGVPRGVVAGSVVLESLLLSLIGIVLGVAAAYGGTYLVGQLVNAQTSISFQAPELTQGDWLRALILLPVAVLFALLPALRSARGSPLEQL